MANIIFYVSVIVAVVSMITANVIMLRYMHNHLQSVAGVQDKFIETLRIMELAHQTTFEALRATEDTLKYVMEVSKNHEDEIRELRDDLKQLSQSTSDIHNEINSLKQSQSRIDDLK